MSNYDYSLDTLMKVLTMPNKEQMTDEDKKLLEEFNAPEEEPACEVIVKHIVDLPYQIDDNTIEGLIELSHEHPYLYNIIYDTILYSGVVIDIKLSDKVPDWKKLYTITDIFVQAFDNNTDWEAFKSMNCMEVQTPPVEAIVPIQVRYMNTSEAILPHAKIIDFTDIRCIIPQCDTMSRIMYLGAWE